MVHCPTDLAPLTAPRVRAAAVAAHAGAGAHEGELAAFGAGVALIALHAGRGDAVLIGVGEPSAGGGAHGFGDLADLRFHARRVDGLAVIVIGRFAEALPAKTIEIAAAKDDKIVRGR